VFTRDGMGWTQRTKLTAGDGAASDSFGRAVASGWYEPSWGASEPAAIAGMELE